MMEHGNNMEKASRPLSSEGSELLKQRIHDDYLERIYAFSYNRLRSGIDAEDLSQEIVLELFSSLERKAQVLNFNAWLWSIAHHTFCHWINRRKITLRMVYYGDSLPEIAGDGESSADRREQLNLLRREISFLSRRHRDVIVGHYLDGKSCEKVAQELEIPLGSVKRLLSEGRDELKNGVMEMSEIGERSYKPGKLGFGINGCGGSLGKPFSLVKRKLAQTILLEAYEEPRRVEELAREIGVACPYIEDEATILKEGELLRQLKDGRYQTDFLILKTHLWKKFLERQEDLALRLMPAFKRAMDAIKTDFLKLQLNSQGLSWKRLLWVMIWKTAHNNANSPKAVYPKRSDGGSWFGLGIETECKRQDGEWPNINGPLMSGSQAGSCHIVSTYWTRGQRFSAENDPNKVVLDNDDITICGLAFSGRLNEGQLDDCRKNKLANLMKDRVIEKRDNTFSLLVTGFTRKQSDAMDALIKDKGDELRRLRKENYDELFNLFRTESPGHITDDNIAARVCTMDFPAGYAYKDYHDRGELEPFDDPEKPFTPSMCLIFNE